MRIGKSLASSLLRIKFALIFYSFQENINATVCGKKPFVPQVVTFYGFTVTM
jgi:hypothetical protein